MIPKKQISQEPYKGMHFYKDFLVICWNWCLNTWNFSIPLCHPISHFRPFPQTDTLFSLLDLSLFSQQSPETSVTWVEDPLDTFWPWDSVIYEYEMSLIWSVRINHCKSRVPLAFPLQSPKLNLNSLGKKIMWPFFFFANYHSLGVLFQRGIKRKNAHLRSRNK